MLWPLVDDAEPETSSKRVYSLLAARKHWHKKTGREKPSLGLLNSLLFPCLFSPRIKLPLVSFGVICRNYSSHGRVRSWVWFRWRNSATNRSSLYHLVEVGTSYWGQEILFTLTKGMEGGNGDSTHLSVQICSVSLMLEEVTICTWASPHFWAYLWPTVVFPAATGSLLAPCPHLQPSMLPGSVCKSRKKRSRVFQVFTEVFLLSFTATW